VEKKGTAYVGALPSVKIAVLSVCAYMLLHISK
jgi:hypothetical protein